MQKINLYKYIETDGSVSVTPNRRNDTDEVYKVRLVADENKILVNDNNEEHSAIDVSFDDVDLYIEKNIESED